MTNRFLEIDTQVHRWRGQPSQGLAAEASWAMPMAAADRALVVLIENGGVDLGIPELADALLRVLPGASALPDGVRQSLIDFLRERLKALTDDLLESAELALNRYEAAKPDLVGDIVVLRDGSATYAELKRTLMSLTGAGKVIDVVILTHGGADSISVADGIDGAKLRAIKAEAGKPLPIRSVYMMNCVGASLNAAWLDVGAAVSSGSRGNNYLPEPTTFLFWNAWKAGQPFEPAVTGAYRKTIELINDAVRGFVAALPIPGSSLLAQQIDVGSFDFVRDSAPVVQGRGSVTIATDDLSSGQSMATGLATTVMPVALLRSLSDDAAVQGPGHSVSAQGVELIKGFESFQPRKYDDPAGHCTVGYGTLLHKGRCDGRPAEIDEVTEPRATELLAHELGDTLRAIDEMVRVPLTQNQVDALASFAYNVGVGALRQSTLLRKLNGSDYAAVPDELRKWTKAKKNGQLVELPGLVRRRNAEADLFQRPDAVAQSLAAVDYAVPGVIASVRQPSPNTCWATVIAMLRSWREHASIEPRAAIAPGGPEFVAMFDNDQALNAAAAGRLYQALGLVSITSLNPTIDAWEDMLRRYGPLYVDIGYPTQAATHAVLATGISGDGSLRGTQITCIDAADGRTVTRAFADFLAEYEAPSAVNGWPHVITHWPGTVSSQQSLPARHSYRFERAAEAGSPLSQAQFVIAGIAVADAIQIGLGGLAISQAAVAASSGTFTLTYDKAQRLLTNEARAAMAGAKASKHVYSAHLLHLPQVRVGAAWADVVIHWEGNDYGEIGTPEIRRDLSASSDWTHSSANITFTKLDRIPPDSDPRTWPLIYAYEGSYDPIGNGSYEFSGEFEINAFGALKWNRHEVVSRSLADWAISHGPEWHVQRGADVTVPVPPIPADQLDYLRAHLP